MLEQRKNKETGKKQFCLVSTSTGRVLEWFGTKKPTDERVVRSEARVQYFKNKGK